MALTRFWMAALDHPERLALIEPDGRTRSTGELAAAANLIVHGLCARGRATRRRRGELPRQRVAAP